jgi:hypothetical protein
LDPKPRIPLLTDKNARQYTPMARDGDWIDFEAIVSTVKDQTAITPGVLLKDWIEGNRRFFHYKTQQKILKYFPLISARYSVKQDKWQDIDIEIYHHPTHGYNIDMMIAAIKKSLAYFSTNFSSYQFKYLRVVEFPRYQLYGECFPGVIAVSEGYGFIARFDPSQVAYIFRVLAHEVAHMWWGHQIIGANVQGMFVLSETMAQYSALMVAKNEYQQSKLNDYIQIRTDSYFRGRAREIREEVPLLYTNSETPYLSYEKGMVVMNALWDYIGETAINKAMRDFLKEKAFREPPFPTSVEWLKTLEQVTPDQLKYIFTDMFTTITLYENRVLNANGESLANGKFRVKLTYDAHKYRVDGLGKETEIQINDYINFGVFDADGGVLYLKKHWVKNSSGELEFIVDRHPVKVGIDPYYFLVDKHTKDNVIQINF